MTPEQVRERLVQKHQSDLVGPTRRAVHPSAGAELLAFVWLGTRSAPA